MAKSFSVKIDKTKWDFRAIKEKSAQIFATGEIKNEILIEVTRQVNLLKDILVQKIRNHPVSQEIIDGSAAPEANINYSGCCGGYGNLWAFIGFTDGDKPIDDATAPVETHIPRVSARVYKDVVRVTSSFPVKEQVFDNTPMPWAEGRSWAQGISFGIAGFGRFLSTDAGNSDGGIQVKHDNLTAQGNRPNKFNRANYIGPLFSETLAQFNALLRQNFKITKI